MCRPFNFLVTGKDSGRKEGDYSLCGNKYISKRDGKHYVSVDIFTKRKFPCFVEMDIGFTTGISAINDPTRCDSSIWTTNKERS
jgi:hypothetical protein